MKFFQGLRQVEHHGGRARMAPAFEGAGSGRRTKDWTGSTLDINSLIAGSGATLRSRARQSQRNTPWAASGCESYAANLIGTGGKPQSRHPEEAVRQALHTAFRIWTDEADADDITDFYGQQLLIAKNLPTAGEVLARLLKPAAKDFLLVPLKVQLFEADHVSLDKTERSGSNVIRAGIEVDPNRKRVAYWVNPAHPGDTSGLVINNDPQRIPAEEIIHVFIPDRPGQMRGVPGLASAVVKFLDVHRGDDATVNRMTAASMFSLFVRSSQGLDQLMPAEAVGETPEQTRAFVQEGVIPLEPNLIQVLPTGWDVTTPPVPDAGANYDDYMTTQGQMLAAGGFGLAYDQMTGDLRKVSFSGIRAGRNETARRMEAAQHAFLVYQFCRRIWRPWLEAALLAGAFDRLGIPGVSNSSMLSAYNAEPLPFLDVAWHFPGLPSVNPLQDAQAATLRIKSGLSSRSQEIEALGEDPEEVDRQNAGDQQRAERLGVRYGDAADAAEPAGNEDDGDVKPVAPPPKNKAAGQRIAGMVQ